MPALIAQFPNEQLARLLVDFGATQAFIKILAPNDNGKNQVYLGADLSNLGLLPTGEIKHVLGTSKKPGGGDRGPIFRANIKLAWITPDGKLEPAPRAKLIAYPQYPEVRLSGFVSGSRFAPAHLFDIKRRGREVGRVLVLAPLPDGTIAATAFGADTEEARALTEVQGEAYGVLWRFHLGNAPAASSESQLLSLLRATHHRGWIDAVYLNADGSMRPCKGPNCGGVTLETCLGIRPNGFAEPDFQGWEVKQHGVGSFDSPRGSQITLMTPEPSGGAYVQNGPEWFVRMWGYEDRRGRVDRLNFGGNYKSGAAAHHLTGLRMEMVGYDAETGKISGDGYLALFDKEARLAASWSFAKLMDHWHRKHAKAAFIPSVSRNIAGLQYKYGGTIGLGEGAKFKTFLAAVASGVVYYDPGMKLEGAGQSRSRLKRRSQFRVDSRKVGSLYDSYRIAKL